VRILPTALAISAVLHAGAIVWVQSRPEPKPEHKEPVTTVPIEVMPGAAAPEVLAEVTLLDDHSVVTPAPVASSASHTRRGKQAIVASHGTSTETTPAKPETTQRPPQSKLMTMRHPKLEHGPSNDFWAKFEANTKPLQPKEIAGEQLSDEIATAQEHLGNPRWIENATAEQVFEERMKLDDKRYEQSTAELRPDQGGGTRADHKTFKAKFNPDGTIATLGDKRNFRITSPLSGEFDVTDAMMRAKGIDPYSSYKLKVLDETREERVAIGKRYRTQQLAQSKRHMQRNLDRLWSSTTDLAARKAGLFELWDDCAESGSAELIAGGASARDYVLGFIRSKLAAGTTDAFTTAELVKFNQQRKSRAPFAPYEAE
jgi:hypothetical protein